MKTQKEIDEYLTARKAEEDHQEIYQEQLRPEIIAAESVDKP